LFLYDREATYLVIQLNPLSTFISSKLNSLIQSDHVRGLTIRIE